MNVDCTRCYTVARAIQYTYSVDDPTTVPPEVKELIKVYDRELNAIASDNDITLQEAEARINAVIAQFRTLAESMGDERQETTEFTRPNANE